MAPRAQAPGRVWSSGPDTLPAHGARGSQANGGLAWLLPAKHWLPQTPSLPRGLLSLRFLDPIQMPFNYSRQMAMLVIGGNRIRVPGDWGAGGWATALPVRAHQ